MDDNFLLRYNRQLLLAQIDVTGQQKLTHSHVVIVGVGGLGCPAAMYLCAAGIGRITLIDDDMVELTNLQRQLAYSEQDIGKPKVLAMASVLNELNSECQVNMIKQRFDAERQQSVIQSCDVIIDATDNLESRKSINRASLEHRIPLVFAAAIRLEGQLTVFNPNLADSPCYECVFGQTQVNESCAESGVLGTVVGTMGLLQATETIKLITGVGSSPVGRLLLYDAQESEWQTINFAKNPNCDACGSAVGNPSQRN